MAWVDTFLDASFRGVPFELLSTTDINKQTVVPHTLPYTNGGNLESMGFDPETFSIPAIFYGEDYERRLSNFIVALRASGFGELVHPIRGTLTVMVLDYRVSHKEDEVETAHVDIAFMEQGIITELFAVTTPEEPLEQLASAGELVLMAANDRLAAELAPVTQSTTFANKQRALRLDKLMLKSLQDLRKQVQNAVSTLEKAVNAPYEWASSIANLCDNLIDLRAFDSDIIAAKWHSLRAKFKNVLRLPNDGQSQNTNQQRDQQALQQHLDCTTLRNNCVAASILFTADIDQTTLAPTLPSQNGNVTTEPSDSTLTPIELEEICNTLRADAQDLIASIRQFNDPITQADMAVIAALKSAAYAAHTAGLVLLSRKPPLVTRNVETDTPLRLLAHHWYGDHHRAGELLRLNPHIHNPNFISSGEVLNAYAQ